MQGFRGVSGSVALGRVEAGHRYHAAVTVDLEPRSFASFADLEREALGCVRCPLSEGRTQVVFGVGDPHAGLMFVGEGPGEQEDLQGEPFVGRAGQLLTTLIGGIGLTRADVYIANVVKCRPPGNRDPLPLEIAQCSPFLEAQLTFIAPRVVVTLGNFATKLLLDTKEGITKLRGREFPFRDGAVLIPALHPSAVLRNGGQALAQARADFVIMKRALAARAESQ
jgi:uracil-DNA glycosylase family 4